MLEFLKRGFEKTFGAISSAKKSKKIDKESLEEILLEADVAYEIVEEILYYLPPQDEVSRADLRRVMSSYFIYEKERVIEPDKPFVDLILGVNGAGKTTTIAKLANLYKNNGKSVILGACDTFRAGAIEQLRQWSIRLNVPIVATQQGHDPSAVAYEIVEEILYYLPPQDEVSRADLRRVMSSYFIYEKERVIEPDKPFVDLILGVNGAGKTTTIAKLANLYKNNGKSVILGACDTFRAGAIEQLRQWSIRLNVPIVATQQGHDPSAVAYDTISSALAKGIDRVILDTAGRLQNQTNLANELDKIVRISKKAYEKAPHRKILILDGTQGNAGVAQAKAFNEIVSLDGVIITKLDGTAKGGALFGVARELELPIFYIGVGESMDDIIKFNPDEFLDELMDAIFE